MKNLGGRPTKMTKETLQKLREAFLMGCSDDEACLYAKIAPQTLYTYQKETKGFLEEKTHLKRNPTLKARKTIYQALAKPNTAQWYLERKAKDEFSERKEITGKDGQPTIIEVRGGGYRPIVSPDEQISSTSEGSD